MSDKHFLSLDYEGIKSNFPVALTAVEGWFMGNNDIAHGLKGMGVDIGQSGAIHRLVASVLKFDPRKLYDVFDDLGCRIFITDHEINTGAPVFYYYNSINRKSGAAATRHAAETSAFLEAFETLEKTLADGENKERVQTPDTGI